MHAGGAPGHERGGTLRVRVSKVPGDRACIGHALCMPTRVPYSTRLDGRIGFVSAEGAGVGCRVRLVWVVAAGGFGESGRHTDREV